VTEIGRDLLDKQRYNLAKAVAIACNIPRTKLDLWMDDAQLQMHRAILHSFAKASVSLVDHHTASDSFIDFMEDEIRERKKCPADWVWIVPPAGGAMTSVFHQEMVNFIVKPQYRPNIDLVQELAIPPLEPLLLTDEECTSSAAINTFNIDKGAAVYDKIIIAYGSETGRSQRFAIRISMDLVDLATTGPISLDDLPSRLPTPGCKGRTLVLVITSTHGKGNAPRQATAFLPMMQDMISASGTLHDTSFAVFALGCSAYKQSFAAFGYDVYDALESIGAVPVLNCKVGDELMDQERSFTEWREDILDNETGILYKEDIDCYADVSANVNDSRRDLIAQGMVKLTYQGFVQVVKSDTRSALDNIRQERQHISWSSYSSYLGRSTDLFSFQVSQAQSSKLNDLRPGDHIAIYPKNLDDAVDLCMRMVVPPNNLSPVNLQECLKNDVDLSRPVSTAALADLWEITKNERARFVIASMLRKAKKDQTDESVIDLINKLPPGSLPCDWLFSRAPAMDPRFYSIASISTEEGTISICQGVYTFPSGHTGTTSRWLRSLQADDEAYGVLSQSDLHLPTDEESPVLMIATGTGIAPFRSFWMSNARNPLYLFFGCINKKDLPFASEIESLNRAGRLHPFIAYSREINNKLHVQDLVAKESDTVLSLLHNPKSHIYICGSPDMAKGVNERLLMIMCHGNNQYPGMKMAQAMEKLIIMKQCKRFISEVYGTISITDDAIGIAWMEATSNVVKMTIGLKKLNLPRPRVEDEFKTAKAIKNSFVPVRRRLLKRGESVKFIKNVSWARTFRPEYESLQADLGFQYAERKKRRSISDGEKDEYQKSTSFFNAIL